MNVAHEESMEDQSKLRLDKLRRRLKKEKLDALLVSSCPNVTYLTGFTGDSSYLLVTPQNELLITDFRFITQLDDECPWLEYYSRAAGETMSDAVPKIAEKHRLQRLGFEADSLTFALHSGLANKFTGQLIPTNEFVEVLRMIKDKQEIAEIRKAISMAQRAFRVIQAAIQPDQTEKQIAADLEHQIRRFRGVGFSFPPIVGVGRRAALPHGIPTDTRIDQDDFVLIDWGANTGLYVSDLTRVIVTGRLSPKLQKVYDVVLRAQLAAIELIRPGAIMSEVDAAARSLIADAGYGKYFGHGLGHGIGLQVHEKPWLGVNRDEPLKAGMVVTVEPGIYLPNWGGVRIEDDVLVTRNGHEVLSDLPKDLESCVIA